MEEISPLKKWFERGKIVQWIGGGVRNPRVNANLAGMMWDVMRDSQNDAWTELFEKFKPVQPHMLDDLAFRATLVYNAIRERSIEKCSLFFSCFGISSYDAYLELAAGASRLNYEQVVVEALHSDLGIENGGTSAKAIEFIIWLREPREDGSIFLSDEDFGEIIEGIQETIREQGEIDPEVCRTEDHDWVDRRVELTELVGILQGL